MILAMPLMIEPRTETKMSAIERASGLIEGVHNEDPSKVIPSADGEVVMLITKSLAGSTPARVMVLSARLRVAEVACTSAPLRVTTNCDASMLMTSSESCCGASVEEQADAIKATSAHEKSLKERLFILIRNYIVDNY